MFRLILFASIFALYHVAEAVKYNVLSCNDGTAISNLFSAGSFHTCAASGSSSSTSGQVRNVTCWGWQEFGQCMPPSMDMVSSIAGGSRHTCATDSRSLVKCWGSNVYGQLDVIRHKKDQVCTYCLAGVFITDPNLRAYMRCEDLSSGSLAEPICKYECSWPIGKNWTGIFQGFGSPSPGTISSGTAFYRKDGKFMCSASKVTAGGMHTCVLYGDPTCSNCNDGLVICYGSNIHGQLDVPLCYNQSSQGSEMGCRDQNTPFTFRDISAGLFHTCGILLSQRIVCWGDNRFQQCASPSGDFVKVSCGAYHSCAITVDGNVICWGYNSYQQGLSSSDLVSSQAIPAGSKFISISCGASHTCGVVLAPGRTILGNPNSKQDTGGKVVCWGANYAQQATPPSQALQFAIAVSVGWEHSCAVGLNDLAVICWGGQNWKNKGSGLGGLGEPTAVVPGCINVCETCLTGFSNTANYVRSNGLLLLFPVSLMLSLMEYYF